MTVNPGQAGQTFLPYVSEKIQQLVKLKNEYGFELELDGACTPSLIEQYYPLGVDSFVLGTAGLFRAKGTYEETIRQLRYITGNTDATVAPRKIIKYLVTDVDGTLTDGKIYMGNDGEVFKAFDIKDGYALHDLLPQNGITPVIVTGRQSKIVENRANELEVTHIFQGIKDKLLWVEKFANGQNITLAEIAYIGDDIGDTPCIKSCGFGGCPADAAYEVRQSADYICKEIGGSAAVRDFAEEVVRRNNE
jgi:3-deoxy-D-manno-octulosonate 8-phosphate phosphatase (KDO 8-P phosphatase)